MSGLTSYLYLEGRVNAGRRFQREREKKKVVARQFVPSHVCAGTIAILRPKVPIVGLRSHSQKL